MFAQINLENLFSFVQKKRKFRPVPEYPSIDRDISLAVKEEVAFQSISESVRKLGGTLLAEINFKEQYLGEKIPAGHRGIIFSLVYRSLDRTLREKEINVVHDKICKSLVEKFAVIIR